MATTQSYKFLFLNIICRFFHIYLAQLNFQRKKIRTDDNINELFSPSFVFLSHSYILSFSSCSIARSLSLYQCVCVCFWMPLISRLDYSYVQKLCHLFKKKEKEILNKTIKKKTKTRIDRHTVHFFSSSSSSFSFHYRLFYK